MDVDVLPTHGQIIMDIFCFVLLLKGRMLFSRFYMAIWTKIHFNSANVLVSDNAGKANAPLGLLLEENFVK